MKGTQTTISTRRKLVIAGIVVLVASLTVALPSLLIGKSFEPQALEPPPLPALSTPHGEAQPFQDMVTAFYERVPIRAPEQWHFEDEDIQEDCYEIAYAFLNDTEPPETLFQLFAHPDPRVRAAALYGLDKAVGVFLEDGNLNLKNHVSRLSDESRNHLMRTCIEVLIEDTNAGRDSPAPKMFHMMGDQSAIPFLVWSGSVHPSSNMRTWNVNVLSSLNPEWKVLAPVFVERLLDPNADVRREAVQTTFLYGVESLLGYR